MNKPLVTAILIGKFEQLVCYKGIQKLCFVCGRMRHKQDHCPHVIRHELSPKKAEMMAIGEREFDLCIECVTHKDKPK